MKRAIQVVWFAIRAVYDEMFLLTGMGLIWFLVGVAIPSALFALVYSLSPVAGLIAGLLSLGILLPPVSVGLYSVAVEIAREKRIEFGYFWKGIRSYAGLGWALGALILISGIVLVTGVSIYLSSGSQLFLVLGFLELWALLFWLAAQIYLFPLLIMLEEKPVRLSIRNTTLLVLAYPFFALGILIVALLTSVLSVALVILLVTIWMPFITILCSRATVSSLEEAKAFQQRHVELEQELEEDQPEL